MHKDTITIPGHIHGFRADTYIVQTYDAQTPSDITQLDASAITVDPVTHDVTVRLATGAILTTTPPATS